MFGKGWTAVGEETDNRFLLLDFCRANDLIVANTWFQQPAAKQVTFKEPSTIFCLQIIPIGIPLTLRNWTFAFYLSGGVTPARIFTASQEQIWTPTIFKLFCACKLNSELNQRQHIAHVGTSNRQRQPK
jgi:hypothetical protein